MDDRQKKVNELLKTFSDEELWHHEEMLAAGWQPEAVGKSMVYTKPATRVLPKVEGAPSIFTLVLKTLKLAFWR